MAPHKQPATLNSVRNAPPAAIRNNPDNMVQAPLNLELQISHPVQAQPQPPQQRIQPQYVTFTNTLASSKGQPETE